MSRNDAKKSKGKDIKPDTTVPKEETVRQEEEVGQEEGVRQEEPASETSLLEQQLAEEQKKSAEYLDRLKRSHADLINYKRRSRQEQMDARARAEGALLERVLPVLDDLGRAMASMPPELADNPWVEGVALTARQLMNTLEQLGVTPVGEPGETFDPYKHDAILRMPSPKHAEGTIIQVIRPGYMLRDRVLRPAQVVVASSPAHEENA
ncbi:nucleotide exchange factor GrpE [Dictyobacter formicarum]|uniref:Protein GrpE n=1 Tax=Dictyobacter formicarum TaxID=2778368 RepID=A0ABQ3VW23_9CHLR|nr:nucleotide exchange factor GrpE [Dictyobacter formicarum]GHO89768.1 protein GrpE [Dictyobacter formicarum]